MFPKAIACFLAALTLIGPGLCCCSLGEAAHWIAAGVLNETGIPQPSSCCHRLSGVDYRNGERDGCQSGHAHDASESSGHTCGQPDSKQPGDSEDCPCREDGTNPTAVPSSSTLATSSVSAAFDAAPVSYLLPALSSFASDDVVARASFSAPRGVCEDGQGILRAYGRLRI